MGATCGAKTRAGTPCQRAPTKGRIRCRLHGGATPRGPASPHWRHGLRSAETRAAAEDLARGIANLRREYARDRWYFSRAMWEDIGVRLALLEVAVFGQAREWFEVTPSPDNASVAAAIYPNRWGDYRTDRNRAWREGLDALDTAGGGERNPMDAATAPTPDDAGGGE